jgi:ferritin-like metal-binding protein YciE
MRFYLSRRTGLAHGDKAGLIAARSAWETGEIAKAQALARDALAAQPGSDEVRHLLFQGVRQRGLPGRA